MILPNGVALRLHLTMPFAAQCQTGADQRWRDPFPIEPTVDEPWTCGSGLSVPTPPSSNGPDSGRSMVAPALARLSVSVVGATLLQP